MRAVITVIGKDTVGIIAKVSDICAKNNVNILDISQSIVNDFFCMMMVVDISLSSIKFTELVDILTKFGEDEGLSIHAMHEEIFNSMHRI